MCLDAPNAPSGSTLSGASTFITSAPQSASCLTAVGPDLTLDSQSVVPGSEFKGLSAASPSASKPYQLKSPFTEKTLKYDTNLIVLQNCYLSAQSPRSLSKHVSYHTNPIVPAIWIACTRQLTLRGLQQV